MSVIIDVYTHYIEGVQVHPSGEWEIIHGFPEGCIFSRREFSGTLTFGNIRHNGISDDYDYLIGFGIQYCQRLSYEIYCNNELYWEGYINHTLDYEVDEDNCTIKTTPLLSDEYDCFVIYGDVEYLFNDLTNRIEAIIYNGYPEPTTAKEYTCDYVFLLSDIIDQLINDTDFINADSLCGFAGNIVSSFFWQDDYPDDTGVIDNYITGRIDFNDIGISEMEVIRDCLGSLEVSNVWNTITFNELMSFLKDAFNVYWYIDANGDFRLEHLHYFEHDFDDRDHTLLPNDIDLITIENDYTDKAICIYKNKWEHLKVELTSEEELIFMDADGEDFIGLPIKYDIDCTYNYPKKTKKEYNQQKFFTDLPMLITDVDSVTIDGFFICALKHENQLWANNDINDWPTDTYTVFDSVNDSINDAQQIGAGLTYARSNAIDTFSAGEVYEVWVTYNNTAGQDPTLKIVDNAGNARSNIETIDSHGIYTFTITPGANFIAYLQYDNDIACQWSAVVNIIDIVENEWIVQWATGAITAGNVNNGHMSIANLMDNYWRYGRVLDEGTMNNNPEIFESIKPNKLQVPIIIPKCCERIHWNTYYDTYLGTGKIYKAAEKKYTHEIELLYE